MIFNKRVETDLWFQRKMGAEVADETEACTKSWKDTYNHNWRILNP